MKKIRRRYTKEFKRQVVALMDDSKTSNEQMAKELEIDIIPASGVDDKSLEQNGKMCR